MCYCLPQNLKKRGLQSYDAKFADFSLFFADLQDRVKYIIVICFVDRRNSDRNSDCVRLLDIRVRVHPAGLLQVPNAARRPQAPRGN